MEMFHTHKELKQLQRGTLRESNQGIYPQNRTELENIFNGQYHSWQPLTTWN